MTEPRVSSFELDLALLGVIDPQGWPEPDQHALEQLRREDRLFLEHHPRETTVGTPILRGPRRAPKLIGLALAASVLAALAIVPAFDDGLRPKGASAVTMFVKRGERVAPFDGSDLSAGDALVFRYTTTRRHVVLAGVEDSGRTSVYAELQIEPGDELTLPTGVELDGHVGSELVVAIFSDEPIDTAALVRELARVRVGDDPLPELAPAADQAAWRIFKKELE